MDDLNDIHQVSLDAGWFDRSDTPQAALAKRRTWLEWAVRNGDALANLNQPPYGDMAVTLKGETKLIGSVGYVPCIGPFGLLPYYRDIVQPGAERLWLTEFGLFWALKQEYQGQGYATEAARALIEHAFKHLRLARIIAQTQFDNAPSIAVMRRLGMSVEKNTTGDPPWFQVTGILENRGAFAAAASP